MRGWGMRIGVNNPRKGGQEQAVFLKEMVQSRPLLKRDLTSIDSEEQYSVSSG